MPVYVWLADPRSSAPRRLPRLRLGVLRLSRVRRYPGVILFFTPSQVPGPPHPAGLGGFLPRLPDPAIPKERRGSPTFPSDPADGLPRSQTPVVSCVLRPGASRTTAFRRMDTVGFPLHPAEGYPCGPRLYLFRGSITRPVTLLPLAPHLHDCLSTEGSLLTRWLDVWPVGLEPPHSHPLGHHSEFHGISPLPSLRASLGATRPWLAAFAD